MPPIAVRGPTGDVHEIDERDLAAFRDQGYVPVTEEAHQAALDAAAQPDLGHGGIAGGINAFATGALSGLTFGGSDFLLRALGTKGTTEAIRQDRANHPVLGAAGQILGSLAPAVVAPESLLAKTPAGLVARAAGRGTELARAAGGAKALIGTALISGGEAAAQNAGMYLSDVALGNRDLTAEGMAGALGRGFVFGGVAGGATYGLERGTMAARRMFARTAEGGAQAAADVGATFARKTDELLQAHDDTAAIAKARLDEIRRMKAEAQATKAAADSEIARAKLDLAEGRVPAPTSTDLADQVRKDILAGKVRGEVGPFTPEGLDQAVNREMLRRHGIPSPAVETATEAPATMPTSQPETQAPAAAPEPTPAEPTPAAAPAATPLEAQLREMQQRTAAGEKLADITEPLGPDLAAEEQRLESALGTYAERRAKVNEWIDRIKNPRTAYEADATTGKAIGEGHLPLIRSRKTITLPEDVMVEQSGGLIRTIGKGEHSLEDITPNSRILARSNGESFTTGTQLDEAYQDAVERAALAEHPAARDAALHEAADIEQQIHRYVRATKPENAAVIDQIERVRAEAGRTGYHAAFARAERRAEAMSGAVPAKLAAGEPASEVAFLDAVRAAERAGKTDLIPPWKPGTLEDVHEASQVLGDYEKAAADLVDAVGDAAPPAAQEAAAGYRQAEDATDRKVIDRTTRAIDDHVASGEQIGPVHRSPAERIATAKGAKLEANAKLADLKEQELHTRVALKSAAKTVKAGRKLEKAAEPQPAAPPRTGALGKLERVGEILELAHMAHVPGLPSPDDIPVIGPVLGLYLKWRALGRLLGRVPATGEARAAALAATTRNKVASAVDRMLGIAERAAPRARTVAVHAGGVAAETLAKRIIDDGHPDAPRDASPQQLAAVRVRELAAAATNPQLVIAKVREQLKDIRDPDLIAAAEQLELRKVAYLHATAPTAPPENPLAPRAWVPPMAETMRLARRLQVSDDPEAALRHVESKTLTPEAAETLRNVYPNLFAEAQQRMLAQVAKIQVAVPYEQRVRMSLLFDAPLDRTLEPATLASLQAVHAPAHATPSPAAPTQTQPPTPSVAGPVNLARLYAPDTDRRIARR